MNLIPLWDDEKDSVWMLPGYLDGIYNAGGIPLIMPLTEDIELIQFFANRFDGFLFTGGHDISPSLYGEEKSKQCGQVCRIRDKLEQHLFTQILKLDKPAFRICRGIQAFNAFLGGSLYQDLPSRHVSGQQVSHKQSPPYHIPAHTVEIVDSPLMKCVTSKEIRVNSYHQAAKTLSAQLSPMAYSPDGLIEAVYMPSRKYIWAVQWHPEFALQDIVSQKLFSSFVEACSDRLF